MSKGSCVFQRRIVTGEASSPNSSVSTVNTNNKLLTEQEFRKSVILSDYSALANYYGVINANDNAYELMTSDSTIANNSGYINSIKIKCGASVAGTYSITFMTAKIADKTLGSAVSVTDNVTIANIPLSTNEQDEAVIPLLDRAHPDGLSIDAKDYLFVGFLSATTTPFIKLARGTKAEYPNAQIIGTNAQDLSAPTVSFVGASGAQTFNHLMMEYAITNNSDSSYCDVLENTSQYFTADNIMAFDTSGNAKDSGKSLSDLELVANKVTSVSVWATDTQYPTAKAIRNIFPTTAGDYVLHIADDGAWSWITK